VRVVVDAAVAVKWFIPEIHATEAACLLEPGHQLLAPDLLMPEVGNVLWKKVRRGELRTEEAHQVLRGLSFVPLEVHASSRLLPAALEIAVATGRTVYDSLYLALAEASRCRLVTADRRLVNALAHGSLSHRLLWIGNVGRAE
jgi:predicted nucleic acid-binding protein